MLLPIPTMTARPDVALPIIRPWASFTKPVSNILSAHRVISVRVPRIMSRSRARWLMVLRLNPRLPSHLPHSMEYAPAVFGRLYMTEHDGVYACTNPRRSTLCQCVLFCESSFTAPNDAF